MSIAQLSVAGEADTRLLPADSPPNRTDDEAFAQFSCDTTNLPWIIFRAVHRGSHVVGLPARSRAVLAALARTVDAGRPFAAIYARRELLTGRAMQSMRTFYRSLDDLETAGLITRPPQQRYGEAGLYGRAYLHLTDKAAQLLGLVEPPPPSPAGEVASNGCHAPAKATDAAGQLIRSASVADRAIYKDLFPASQKRQHGQLPEDLKRLQSVGFNKNYIFKLMGIARRQYGKFLSDVVAACWDQIRAATYPISYLNALLAAPTDFAWIAKQRGEAANIAREGEQRKARLESLRRRLADGVFFDREADKRYVVATDGLSVTVHSAEESTPRVNNGLWITWFAEGMESGVIVPENAERAASFEEKLSVHRQIVTMSRQAAAAPRADQLPWQNSERANESRAALRSFLGLRTPQIATA
ncbi:hypothetical protein R70006_04990 [Paraburkholderia domus]|nr:hypothetical protein R70006_04990 [Paraburkholderia domus]